MFVKIEEEKFSKEVYDPETGELISLTASRAVSKENYSIKKLNSRICIMDIAQVMEAVCSSKKDIYIFWKIVDALDKENTFRKAVLPWSKQIGVSDRHIRKILTACVKAGFLKRIERGVYLANPYWIQAKGATKETIRQLQKEWNE